MTRRHLVSPAVAVALLGLLAWQGHHLAGLLPQLEQEIESLGPWGPFVFLAGVLLLAPLLLPDTIFGVTAGVAFGLGMGFAYYFVATYAASLLSYLIGRRWLRTRVLASLEARPALRAMATAARSQGLRLTVWIRLVPINPVAVSYALGAADVPSPAVAIGTLAMFPHMFLTVYLGVAAAHVTRMAGQGHAHWTLDGVGLLLGLFACVGLMLQIGSTAWRQVHAAAAEAGYAGGVRPEQSSAIDAPAG